MRSLQDVLGNDFGIDLGGWILIRATDISADGRTIVGYGFNPSALGEAWVAVLPLEGDANYDGKVDGGDYTIWADNYRTTGNWQQADFNGDGFVDGADYTLWADNYSSGCAGSPVPEPCSAAIVFLALATLAARRRG